MITSVTRISVSVKPAIFRARRISAVDAVTVMIVVDLNRRPPRRADCQTALWRRAHTAGGQFHLIACWRGQPAIAVKCERHSDGSTDGDLGTGHLTAQDGAA